MKIFTWTLLASLFIVAAAKCDEPVAKQFVRHLCGGDGIELAKICHPTPDLWMLDHNTKDAEALMALDALHVEPRKTGVTPFQVALHLFFVETRDNKVDASLNLENEYTVQKTIARTFVYFALQRDKRIGEVVTDPAKVEIIGPTAAGGDMDVYAMVLEVTPVVRVSRPADDAKAKAVTYRFPIGDEALTLVLTKVNGKWKVDSSKKVRVPLDWYFAGAKTQGSPTSYIYDVSVGNGTKQQIEDVEIKFDDGSWAETVGVKAPGTDATFSGITGMPPIPPSATIRWRDASAKRHTAVAKISDDIRGKGRKNSELGFTIQDDDTIKVKYQER
jgi:hypothetical protein